MPYRIHNKENYKFLEVVDEKAHSSVWTFIDEEGVRKKLYYPYLKNGMNVLDVGCAWGSYTLAALGRGCNVTAFNPHLPEPNLFLKNMELNKNFEQKWKLVEKAVYSKKGYLNQETREFVDVERYEDIPPDYREPKKLKLGDSNNFFTECDTLDNLYKGKVDFIKIDVEGAELEVIKGAMSIIKSNIPYILVENHNFIDPTLSEKIKDLLINEWGLGYEYETKEHTSQVSHTLFYL